MDENTKMKENTKMEAEQPREEERPLLPAGVKQEPGRKEAKVVGSVNASTIARIVRVFCWKGLECAEL